MNQYHIRIDGEQSIDSYTFQELADMGLFELDAENLNGIEVKKTIESNFTLLKLYCFPERQSNDSLYYVDEYGQIHRRTSNQNNAPVYVPDSEQIVRLNNYSNPVRNSPTSTSTNNPSSNSSRLVTSNSSKSNNGEILLKIIGTIIVLAIGIPIITNVGLDGFWGCTIFVVGFLILGSIWDWGDFL